MNIERDTRQMKDIIQSHIDIDSVARFKGNDHIIKLDLKFDLEKMREALIAQTAAFDDPLRDCVAPFNGQWRTGSGQFDASSDYLDPIEARP